MVSHIIVVLFLLLGVTFNGGFSKRFHSNGKFPVHQWDIEKAIDLLSRNTQTLNSNLQNTSTDDKSFFRPSVKDHQVFDLPGLKQQLPSKHFAGHLPVTDDPEGGYLFYWLFEAEEDPDNKPLIIWLNGGPGCSSLGGLFQELGPFKVVNNGTQLELNPYSWHKSANILFVDQPVGTGLAFAGREGYASSQMRVNMDFYRFLQNFLNVHTNYKQTTTTRDIYFFGESYAGRYIPSIVDYILQRNMNPQTYDVVLKISGMGIGNGWTHPLVQFNYVPFGLATGLIGEQQGILLTKQYEACTYALNKGETLSKECDAILDRMISESTIPGGNQVNYYDIRLYIKDVELWPAGIDQVQEYLSKRDVRKSLHATRSPHQWASCSDPVNSALAHEDGVSTLPQVENILQAGIRSLFYNGRFDLICNHMGTSTFLNQLNWNGRNGYRMAQRSVWAVDNSPAGYVKTSPDGILTFLVFLGGSHMAPMDEPKQALDMLDRFIEDRSFVDYQQSFVNLPVLVEEVTMYHVPVGVTIVATLLVLFLAVVAYKYLVRISHYHEIPSQP